MRKISILFLLLLFVFVSCKGQNETVKNTNEKEISEKSDVQTEIDKSTDSEAQKDYESQVEISEYEYNEQERTYTRYNTDDSAPITGMYSLREGLNGFIDSNGKVAYLPEYVYPEYLEPEYAVMRIEKENGVYKDVFGNSIEGTKALAVYVLVNLKTEEVFGYFDQATGFSREGLAVVKDAKGRFHTVNKDFEIISTLDNSSVQHINMLHDGMAVFVTDDRIAGYVNDKLEIVIEPKYHYAENFSEGLAFVSDAFIDADFEFVSEGKKSGFIDKTGDMIIEIHNDFMLRKVEYTAHPDPILECSSFSDGLAHIYIPGGELDGLSFETNRETPESYYVDKNGNRLLEGVYGGDFNFGLAPAKDSKTGKYGFIDKTGTFVIEPQFSYAYSFNDSGVALVFKDDEPPYDDPNRLGYINTKGEMVIPFEYDMPRLFPEDIMENGIVCLYKSKYHIFPHYYIRSDGTILGKMELNE